MKAHRKAFVKYEKNVKKKGREKMKKIIGLSAAICLLISVMAGFGAFAAGDSIDTIYDIDFDSWDINVDASSGDTVEDLATALENVAVTTDGTQWWQPLAVTEKENPFAGDAKIAAVNATDENAAWTGRGKVLKISGSDFDQTATAHTDANARLGIGVPLGKDFTKISNYDSDKLYIEYDLFVPSLGTRATSFVRYQYTVFGVNDYATAVKHERNTDTFYLTSYKTIKFNEDMTTPASGGSSYNDRVGAFLTPGDWYRVQYVLDMQDATPIDIVDHTGATVSSSGRRTMTISTKNLRTNETSSERVVFSTRVLADKLIIGGYYSDQYLYGDFYLDNVNIYTRDKFAFESSADDEATNVAFDKKTVSFTMNAPVLASSLTGITLTGGGNTVSTTAALSESDNKTVVVTIGDDLAYSTPYTLDFSSVKREDGEAIALGDKTITFTTQAPPALYVTETKIYSGFDSYMANETEISADGGLYTFAAQVQSTVETSKPATAIIAVYDANGKFVNASYVSKNIPALKEETIAAGMTVPASLAGGTVKLFLWNKVNMMQPYIKPLAEDIAAAN